MKGGAFDPTWSPDGTRIAFAGTRLGGLAPRRDSDIFVMSASGGPIRRLLGTAQNDAHPDWSPDGTSVAFHSRYGRAGGVPGGLIWVASIGARTPTQLTLRHTQYAGVDPV